MSKRLDVPKDLTVTAFDLIWNTLHRHKEGYWLFESLCGFLLQLHYGFKDVVVSKRRGRGDGGKDIEFVDKKGNRGLAECKFHAAKVGPNYIKEFWSSVHAYQSTERCTVQHLYYFSFNDFSRGASDLAARTRIQLGSGLETMFDADAIGFAEKSRITLVSGVELKSQITLYCVDLVLLFMSHNLPLMTREGWYQLEPSPSKVVSVPKVQTEETVTPVPTVTTEEASNAKKKRKIATTRVDLPPPTEEETHDDESDVVEQANSPSDALTVLASAAVKRSKQETRRMCASVQDLVTLLSTAPASVTFSKDQQSFHWNARRTMHAWRPSDLELYLLEMWPESVSSGKFDVVLRCGACWSFMSEHSRRALRELHLQGKLCDTNLRLTDFDLLNRFLIDRVLDKLDGTMSLERAIVDNHIKPPAVKVYREVRRDLLAAAMEHLCDTPLWMRHKVVAPRSIPAARVVEIGLDAIK
jgi:hypothetical protein